MVQQLDSEGLQVHGAESPQVVSYHSQLNSNDVTTKHGTLSLEPPLRNGTPVPFGLGIWTFAILVVVTTAIVVGGGVGGGCGAALANCHKSDCPQPAAAEKTSCLTPDNNEIPSTNETFNNDTTPYIQRAAGSIPLLQLECPDKFRTKSSFKSNRGYDFTWYCGVNAPAGEIGSRGGPISDVGPIIAYSLEDCLNACGTMIERDERQDTGVTCRSVVFNSRLASAVDALGGNCFLKNDTKAGGSTWGFTAPQTLAYAERDE